MADITYTLNLDPTPEYIIDVGTYGTRGQGATVTVGNTVTLHSGLNVTVDNTGTSTDAILNFSIPKGSTWYNGTSAPDSSIGMEGDYYLNLSNNHFYVKTDSTNWNDIGYITATSTWGTILGTLSAQTDLQDALNLKANTSTTINSHPLTSDVTITKSDIGLGNVTNIDASNADNITSGTLSSGRLDTDVTLQGNTFNGNSQLIQTTAVGKYPALDGSLITNISGGGGVVDFDNKGTVTTNITLTENKITTGYWSGTNSIALPTVTDTTKQVVCILDFTTATSSRPTITNTNLKWSDKNGGKPPATYSTLTGVRNKLIFKSTWEGGLLYWEAEYTSYGGVEKPYVQSVLSANGTLGGASEAVYASNVYSTYDAYKAGDNNNSTYFESLLNNYYTRYCVNPVKATSITIRNQPSGLGDFYSIGGYTLYGSNDNYNWVALASGTNTVTDTDTSWDINIPLANQSFYKYYKIYVTSSPKGTYYVMANFTINGVQVTT